MSIDAPQYDSSPTKAEWLGLLAISLGVALVVVDFTIVNVIIPPIIDDLKIISFDAQWVQESYAIIIAALLLLVGRLSDVVGARKLFLIGAGIFAVASVTAALSPNGGALIASRFVQGIGGAFILPTSLSLLNFTFQGPARGKAFAIWGSTIGAAAAVGPLLGGWLGGFSWRLAFGINLAVVALIFLGVLRYVNESPIVSQRVDRGGAVLSVVGLGLLAFGLIEGRNYGWLASTREMTVLGVSFGAVSPVPIALVVAVVCLVAFLLYQRRLTVSRTREPLMDVGLFSIASFRNGNLATIIIGLAEFGILAVLPLWLQFTLGYSTFQAGLALAVVALGSFFASGASFGMADKTTPIGFVRLGLVAEAVGLVLLAVLVSPSTSWWAIALALFIYGVGVGFATAQVTNVVLADVPPRNSGQASGIQSAARQLGSAMGIAILTTTFFSTFTSNLTTRLSSSGVSPESANAFAQSVADSAGAAIVGLQQSEQTKGVAQVAREAMSDAVTANGYLCAGLLTLGLLATLLIPKSVRLQHGQGEPLAAADDPTLTEVG